MLAAHHLPHLEHNRRQLLPQLRTSHHLAPVSHVFTQNKCILCFWLKRAGHFVCNSQTLRHLLSQASGYGRVEPGSFFTYDSDAYLLQGTDMPQNSPQNRDN